MNSLKHASKLLASGLVWLACTTSSVHAAVLDRIVAVVDSGVVLESDVERRLNDLKAQADARGNAIEISDALKEQVLERLILEQAQLEIAKRRGLDIDDARVNETLTQIAENRNTDLLGLKSAIEAEGQSFSMFREQIRRELLINAVREREVRSRIRISESELARFLETTGGQISTAPELLLSQIVVGLPNRPSPEAIDAAQTKITQIRDALLDGAPFGQLAVRFSDAPEANQGGDLGWFSSSDMVSAFGDAVAALETGSLTQTPVETRFGWHVIQLDDTREAEAPAFEEVAGQLRMTMINEQIQATLDELRDSARIRYMVDWASPAE